MSTMSYGRLTWKEYRTQRSLWLSVLFLTVVAQYVFFMAGTLLRDDPFPLSVHIAIPFIGLSVYMLGCGATLFAIEHELGTFDFQRLLPVTAWRVYAAQMTVGIVSGIALIAVLMLVSHVFYIGWRPLVDTIDWLAGGVTATEVFGWSVLFSLLLRHPLRAAIGAIVTTSIIVCLIIPAMTMPAHENFELFVFHRHSLPARGLVILGLVVVDTWLAQRWFHGKIRFVRWRRPQWKRTEDELPTAGALPAYTGGRSIGWWRLVGITWRQGKSVWLLVNLLYIITFIFSFDTRADVAIPMGLVAAGSTVLFGVCAFTFDQWSYHFRYYAERGIDARWLWLSRQAVWLTPILLQSIGMSWLYWQNKHPSQPPAGLVLLLMAISCYAISQLCGMFIRSTLVALVVSIFGSVMAILWTGSTMGADISPWLAVLPIPVWLLFTTWRFSTSWIEERTGRRYWVRVGLFLGIPAFLLFFSCASWRAHQIPLVDPGFSVSEYTRPLSVAEQETLEIYQNAASQMAAGQFRADTETAGANRDASEGWYEFVKPALPSLVAAHEHTPVPVTLLKTPTRSNNPPRPSYLGDFSARYFMQLLRLHAERLTREEKLGEAWRYYEIHFELLRRVRMRADVTVLLYSDHDERLLLDSVVQWSAHESQTKDLIAVALARLEGNENQEPFQDRFTKIRHVMWRAFLRGEEVHPSFLELTDQQGEIVRRMTTFMPWEKTRMLRLLNVSTRASLDANFVLPSTWATGSLQRWQYTTPFAGNFNRPYSDLMPTYRRAARVLVALSDWRREHGELPESLDELVGTYFQTTPLNPMISQPFFYSSTGIPSDLTVEWPGGEVEIILPENRPFLWSPRYPQFNLSIDAKVIQRMGFLQLNKDVQATIRDGQIWLIPQPAEQ